MKIIRKKINVPLDTVLAFEIFVNDFSNWWPKQYTWSQDTLVSITINSEPGGLCTEIGPEGFRCDWGRVEKIKPGELIELKWQIGASREPVPDPAKASDVSLHFKTAASGTTDLVLEHQNFSNHGAQAQLYQDSMASSQGWEYILDCFKKYSCGL